MRGTIARLLTLMLVIGAASARAAPTTELVIEAGVLTGARNVDVGGVLHDVSFMGGTCALLFDGCDEATDFVFRTEGSARQAATALLDHVFVRDFDTDTALTRGCSSLACIMMTPYQADASGPYSLFRSADAFNARSEIEDAAQARIRYVDDGTDGYSTAFAIWTRSTEVPAPSPIVLAGLGLSLFLLLGGRSLVSQVHRR